MEINKIVVDGKEYIADKNDKGEIVCFRLVDNKTDVKKPYETKVNLNDVYFNKDLFNKAFLNIDNKVETSDKIDANVLPNNFKNGVIECTFYKFSGGTIFTVGKKYKVRNGYSYTNIGDVFYPVILNNQYPEIVRFKIVENYDYNDSDKMSGRAICVSVNKNSDYGNVLVPGCIYEIKDGNIINKDGKKLIYDGKVVEVTEKDFKPGEKFNNSDVYLYLL